MLLKFFKMAIVETTGPSSYTIGGFEVEVGDLSVVEHAIVNVGGGYTGEVVNKDMNKVTIKVYSSAGTEVSAGTDLSSVNVTVVAWGS